MEHIYPIYKPKGPTSHDIVHQVRVITGIKKVGHAGTLDPLASGVLVIGVTREGTKKMYELIQHEKEYVATVKLGETSATDDAEGEKTAAEFDREPTREQVEQVLRKFVGHIKQVPPAYSAVKVKGQKAYKAARKGRELELEARDIEIKEIELVKYEWPMLVLRVATGSGVYVRSLARDIGAALGTGAYLADLERTRVGQYKLEDALTLDRFAELWEHKRGFGGSSGGAR